MIPGPKPLGAAEAALRFMARRGRGDWLALVVEPGVDVPAAAEELAQEMESVGDAAVERVFGADDAQSLASDLTGKRGPVVISGLGSWTASEWAHFDHLRSRFTRDERTALVLGRAAFERLMQEAPNFSSWLGASAVTYQPDSSTLSEEERRRRLEALRAWSGLSDEAVLARAAAGTLPGEPEFAEWLVLLRRGDLLGRGA
jgi:hypothetical protein